MDRIALQILEDGWEQDGRAMRRERGAAGPVIAPIFDCFEARFSPSVRYDSSCFALRRRTSGRSGGIEHPAFTLSGPFDRASLCGPLLELSLTNEQYVNRDRKACERTIEFNEFLMTVDDVSLDDHEVNVASHIGITAGPRSEKDDPLWAGCRHEPFDSGLHLIGSGSPRRCDRCRHQEYRNQRQPAGPRSRPARRSRTAATEAPASPADLKQAMGIRVESPAAAYPTANIASPRSCGGPPPSQVVQPSRDPDRDHPAESRGALRG